MPFQPHEYQPLSDPTLAMMAQAKRLRVGETLPYLAKLEAGRRMEFAEAEAIRKRRWKYNEKLAAWPTCWVVWLCRVIGWLWCRVTHRKHGVYRASMYDWKHKAFPVMLRGHRRRWYHAWHV